jgi:TldD protein
MRRTRLRRPLAQLLALTVGVGAGVLLWLDETHAGPGATSELDAFGAELSRGVAKLRLEDSPAPYAAEVRSLRAQSLTLDGSYGGVVTDLLERQGYATVRVRVGSLESDNTHFFGTNQEPGFVLTLTPNAAVNQRKLWLAMDGAYRAATSAYSAKQAEIARIADDDHAVPDWSPPPPKTVAVEWNEDPLSTADPFVADAGFDREGYRKLVAALSARFADHPSIDNGDVVVQLIRSHEAVVATEGLVLGRVRDRAVIAVIADTQAPDGMRLDHGAAIHLVGLPKAESLRAEGEALVDRVLVELAALAAAPMLEEDYDGPILFEPLAAAQFLASTVVTQAVGTPAPLSEFGRVTELEPQWQDRVGRAVMPSWIDVRDDPGANPFGAFAFDAEGVKAEPLDVVREGILANLFMTRSPNRFISQSNGRARMSPSLQVGPGISNLILTSRKRGLDEKRMATELVRRAREDGYEFAYVVELLREGNVLGPVPRESAATYATGRKVSLSPPARVFRVGADGDRQLVRGAILSPASMRVLRRIRAVGRESVTVPMRLPPGVGGGFTADVHVEGLLSQTVDTTITTPALLIDGLELLVERGEHERLPTLEHPLRRED